MRDHKTLRNINTCAKSYHIITRLRTIEKGLNDRLHLTDYHSYEHDDRRNGIT